MAPAPSALILFAVLLTALASGQVVVRSKICRANVEPIFRESQTRRCPCFLTVSVVVPQPAPGLSISVYALPSRDVASWRTALRTSRSLTAPKRAALRLQDVDVTSFDFQLRSYGWYSGTQSVNASGDYVVAFVVTANRIEPCVTITYLLEQQPDICPLRLAPPEPPPEQPTELPVRAAGAPYVVGGTRVNTNGEFAAYNALVTTLQGNCTASMIAADWVLTAAHCEVEQGAIVRVGGTVLGGGVLRRVRRAVGHPNFLGRVLDGTDVIVNDVAVAQLDAPIENAAILALNVNAKGPFPGTIVRATGYGKVTTQSLSQHLHLVDVAVLSPNECRRRFTSSGRAGIARGVKRKYHVCTGRDNDCTQGGVCFGDSGGPIVARSAGGLLVQIGVTSYGDNVCGNFRSADVFARVSEYVPWIQDTTGGAGTTASWQSINNNGSGNYGSDANAFPMWAVVAISVFAGLVFIALLLFLAVYGFGRRSPPPPLADSRPLPVYDPAPLGPRVSSPDHIAPPPPAAPPSPFYPQPSQMPTAPYPPPSQLATAPPQPSQMPTAPHPPPSQLATAPPQPSQMAAAPHPPPSQLATAPHPPPPTAPPPDQHDDEISAYPPPHREIPPPLPPPQVPPQVPGAPNSPSSPQLPGVQYMPPPGGALGPRPPQ